MLVYDIEKQCEFSLNIIYNLCFSALSIQSYTDQEEAVVLNLCKRTDQRKQKLKVEILYDLKEF